MVVVEGVARQLDPQHSLWESARPVIERWMIDSVGPQARLKEASDGLTALGRAVAALPDALRNAEQIAAALQTGGIRIHPDSARAIGRAQGQAQGWPSGAIWIAAAALVIATIAII
jgi:ubiquinone biosynthesis protein